MGEWPSKGPDRAFGDASNCSNILAHFLLLFDHWPPPRNFTRLCTSAFGLFYFLGGRRGQFTICGDPTLASQGRPYDGPPGSANHSARGSTSVFYQRTSFDPRGNTRTPGHVLLRRSVDESRGAGLRREWCSYRFYDLGTRQGETGICGAGYFLEWHSILRRGVSRRAAWHLAGKYIWGDDGWRRYNRNFISQIRPPTPPRRRADSRRGSTALLRTRGERVWARPRAG